MREIAKGVGVALEAEDGFEKHVRQSHPIELSARMKMFCLYCSVWSVRYVWLLSTSHGGVQLRN